ncbi:hypothetical protein BLOT_006418 [Blomia tropicalis]|nr:hypothetical protein BLOT_006418 [Blomia tropicalis]
MLFHRIAFYIFSCICFCYAKNLAQQRSLITEINPNCNIDCKSSTLVHVESRGTNNTFHYLWTFISKYTPTIIVLETDPKASLSVDWKTIRNRSNNANSIQFVNGTVYNSFAMELSHLYFINATNNVTLQMIPLDEINWNYTSVQTNDVVKFNFNSIKSPVLNGSVQLSLNVFNQAGRGDTIPRLQYTEASNLIQLIVDNIYIKPHGNFSIDAQLISNFTIVMEGDDVKESIEENRSIDDEYTPGIFQRYVYNINSKQTYNKKTITNKTAYIEWKPVAYYDSSLKIAKSIKVTCPIMKKHNLSNASILHAYYSGRRYQATEMNLLKFGIDDDQFNYKDNPYLQFSLAFGLNQVPEESLSMTLKIVIAVGLGLPMILFIASIIYTIVRKFRPSAGFTSIPEETS